MCIASNRRVEQIFGMSEWRDRSAPTETNQTNNSLNQLFNHRLNSTRLSSLLFSSLVPSSFYSYLCESSRVVYSPFPSPFLPLSCFPCPFPFPFPFGDFRTERTNGRTPLHHHKEHHTRICNIQQFNAFAFPLPLPLSLSFGVGSADPY